MTLLYLKTDQMDSDEFPVRQVDRFAVHVLQPSEEIFVKRPQARFTKIPTPIPTSKPIRIIAISLHTSLLMGWVSSPKFLRQMTHA